MSTRPIDSSPDKHPAPWHQQFWPWFLIILPGIVVIASIITVAIAFQRADTLVADNYYKDGMGINQTVSDINTAKTMQIQGVLAIAGNTLNLDITANTPIDDSSLLLHFNHPLDKQLDIAVHLERHGANRYQGRMPELKTGKWYITLQSLNASTPWRLNTTVFMPNDTIALQAE